MAVALLSVRSLRRLPNRVLACCICFTSSSTPTWQSDFYVSSARGMSSQCFDPGGEIQERQKLLWEDLFAAPAEWWDYRFCKTSPKYPDFRHKRTREPLWLNNQYKPVWVDHKLSTLNDHTEGGRVGQIAGSARLADELHNLCEDGQLDAAVDVLLGMEHHGTVTTLHLCCYVLKACIKRKALPQAKRLKALLVENNLSATQFLSEYLVSALVKCGGLEDAIQLFYRLPLRTSFSWTAMISGYTTAGQGAEALKLYQSMLEQGQEPNNYTFASLLKACASIPDVTEGKRIHADTLRYGCETDLFVGTCIVDMYLKCGCIEDAEELFDRLPERSVVSWTAMLAGHAQGGQAARALELYEQMQEQGVSSDDRTFVSVIQACATLADKEDGTQVDECEMKVKCLSMGKALHAGAWRLEYDTNAFVASSLVSLYGKCGNILDAENVFLGLSHRNVVLWTAMFTAYSQHGQVEKALQLYELMQVEGASPDARTFVSALQACSLHAENEEQVFLEGQGIKVKAMEMGKAMHAYCRRRGYDSDIFVGNTLVSMYGRCGSIIDATCVFDLLFERDVVSWNAMLATYVGLGQEERVLHMFPLMQDEGVSPNEVTLMCILQACSNLGRLDICRQIHHTFCERNLSPLTSSLIHAYGRCSSMVDAQRVFDALPQQQVAAWTSLIAGYARQGNIAASLQWYEKMLMAGLKPNGVTFLAILSACSHAGLVDKGVQYFESMTKDFSISPEIDHYVCMVDLLGRAGYFTLVEFLVSTLPMQPNVSIWLCLLGACRKHGKVSLGKLAFDNAVLLQPRHAALYLLMRNIYSQAGLWNNANEVSEMEVQANAWQKPPGQTWIEHGQKLHKFLVGSGKELELESVYEMLVKVSVDTDERECHVPNLMKARNLGWTCCAVQVPVHNSYEFSIPLEHAKMLPLSQSL